MNHLFLHSFEIITKESRISYYTSFFIRVDFFLISWRNMMVHMAFLHNATSKIKTIPRLHKEPPELYFVLPEKVWYLSSLIGIMRKVSKQHLGKPELGTMHAVVTNYRNTPLPYQKACLTTVTENKYQQSNNWLNCAYWSRAYPIKIFNVVQTLGTFSYTFLVYSKKKHLISLKSTLGH